MTTDYRNTDHVRPGADFVLAAMGPARTAPHESPDAAFRPRCAAGLRQIGDGP